MCLQLFCDLLCVLCFFLRFMFFFCVFVCFILCLFYVPDFLGLVAREIRGRFWPREVAGDFEGR